MNISTQAIDKLYEAYDTEKNSLGQKEKVIALPTIDALGSFCTQNEEFARAVIDKEFKAKELLGFCLKDSENAISDHKVFERAAQFFFKTAVIEFQMVIHDSAFDLEKKGSERAASSKNIIVSLADFI